MHDGPVMEVEINSSPVHGPQQGDVSHRTFCKHVTVKFITGSFGVRFLLLRCSINDDVVIKCRRGAVCTFLS